MLAAAHLLRSALPPVNPRPPPNYGTTTIKPIHTLCRSITDVGILAVVHACVRLRKCRLTGTTVTEPVGQFARCLEWLVCLRACFVPIKQRDARIFLSAC